MTPIHYLGAAIILILIAGVGVYSGKQVKSASDFATGGRSAGAGIVAGTIIGTLVGGASTIGTSQLAFNFGFSAWWFTLGGGIGVLIMALFLAKPLYESGISTLPQLISREYGGKCATTATLLTSVGSFLSIVSQVLSGITLITSVSALGNGISTLLVIALMLCYVIFGGVLGAGMVGIAKTILLYISVGVCGVIAVISQGGLGAFTSALPADQYFSLVARGPAVDLGAGVSLILGVMTTQAYIQAVVSAKTLKHSRNGLFLSAILIPLVGVGGIFIGMYQRLNCAFEPGTAEFKMAAAQALPNFVLDHLPPLLAGAVLATLLVAVVGTGAGVSLGISSMFCNDVYKKYINKNASDTKSLLVARLVVAVVLGAAALFTLGDLGAMILDWSFMSMGLRGAVAFGPLLTALFLKGRIGNNFAFASMIVGPILVVVGKFVLPAGIDPLFLGLAASILVLVVGFVVGPKKTGTPVSPN